jgi:hypothetical protein
VELLQWIWRRWRGGLEILAGFEIIMILKFEMKKKNSYSMPGKIYIKIQTPPPP